MKMFLF